MTIEVVDGKPVGYLTVQEYARKHCVKHQCVRNLLCKGRLAAMKIGYEIWISEEAPYPADRRLKENR